MAKRRFSRIRLVYRRSSPLLKGVVIGCIVLALIALLVMRAVILRTREQRDADRARAAQKEQEIAQKEQDLEQKGSIEWIEKIAREKLGLLPEGSEIITPQER